MNNNCNGCNDTAMGGCIPCTSCAGECNIQCSIQCRFICKETCTSSVGTNNVSNINEECEVKIDV